MLALASVPALLGHGGQAEALGAVALPSGPLTRLVEAHGLDLDIPGNSYGTQQADMFGAPKKVVPVDYQRTVESSSKTFSEWTNRLSELQYAGRGSYATVYTGTDKVTGRSVAVKFFQLDTDKEFLGFSREVATMETMTGPDTVSIFDAATAESESLLAFIMMEAADGDFSSQVLRRDVDLSATRKCRMMVEILRGLLEVQEAGFVHRDLKPQNILVFGDCASQKGCHVKIADFGLAFEPDMSDFGEARKLSGAAWYIAPEVWARRGATSKSDLFSVGIILFQLFTGGPPAVFLEERFNRRGPLKHHPLRAHMPRRFSIQKDPGFRRFKREDPELANFIGKLLKRRAWRRPGVQRALEVARVLAIHRGVDPRHL